MRDLLKAWLKKPAGAMLLLALWLSVTPAGTQLAPLQWMHGPVAAAAAHIPAEIADLSQRQVLEAAPHERKEPAGGGEPIVAAGIGHTSPSPALLDRDYRLPPSRAPPSRRSLANQPRAPPHA